MGPKSKMNNVKQANGKQRSREGSRWKTALKTFVPYLESTASGHLGLVLSLRNIDLKDSFSFTEKKVA